MDKLEKSLGKTTNTTKKLDRALDGLNQGLAGLKVALAGLALGALARGFFALSRSIITTAGDIEKLNASFLSLTGSTEGVKELRNTLFQLSKTTPFKNEEILESARRFLAVGVEVKDLEGTLNRVGALAAESGQDLGRLGLIYSQVFAKGRLQGEENLQLLEAGIDLTDELSQVTGLSGEALRDAMSKGQISISDFNKALVLATGDMKVLDAAAKSVSVQLENIGDNAGQLGAAFSTSVAPAFAAIFGTINEAFDKLFPSLQSVQERFDPILEQAERFAKIIEDNPELVDAIASALDSLLTFFLEPIVDAAEDFNDELEKRPQGLIETVQQIELLIRRSFLLAGALGQALQGIGRGLTPGGIIADLAAGKNPFEGALEDFEQASGLFQDALDAKPFEVKVRPVLEGGTRAGSLTDKGGGNGNGNGNGSGLSAEEKKAARLLQQSKELLATSEERIKLAQSSNEYERIGAELDAERLAIKQKFDGLLAQTNDAQTRNNLLLAQNNELIAADMRAQTKINDLRQNALGTIQQENAAMEATLAGKRDQYDIEQKIQAIVKAGRGTVDYDEARALVMKNEGLKEELRLRKEIQGIMRQVGQEAVGLFDTLINGTEDFNKALENTLRQLSSMLLQMGFNAIGNAAGSGSVLNSLFGTRAMGGPVSAGQPYVVGERGPELFVPSQSGGVVANSKMGGGEVNYVQNIYITDDGSRSDGDAGELGRLIESSVVGIIQREKRPGGMLG